MRRWWRRFASGLLAPGGDGSGFVFEVDHDGRPVRVHNTLFDEGERLWLRRLARDEDVLPTAYVLRLFNFTPSPGDSISDLENEMEGNGYTPLEWELGTDDWGAPATNGAGVTETLGIVQQFEATGGPIGPFSHAVFATTADGSATLISFFPIPGGARTIEPGLPYPVRPALRLQGHAL